MNQKILTTLINKRPTPILLEESKSSFVDEVIIDYLKSINCNETKTMCNNCNDCKKIESKNYFDYHELNVYVETVQKEKVIEIFNNLKYSSLEKNGNKFFVFKGIELINKYVSNLMLTTIENPPPKTYIIFVTRNINSVLETIKSRCVSYKITSEYEKMKNLLVINKIDEKYHDFFMNNFYNFIEITNFYNSSSFDKISKICFDLKENINNLVILKSNLNIFKTFNYYEIEKTILMLSDNVNLNKRKPLIHLLNNINLNLNKTLIYNEILNIMF